MMHQATHPCASCDLAYDGDALIIHGPPGKPNGALTLKLMFLAVK